MAAKVAHRKRDLVVVEVLKKSMNSSSFGALTREPLPKFGGRESQQALVLLITHDVDPLVEFLTSWSREELTKTVPVLERGSVPSGRLEHGADPAGSNVGHHTVKRLTVEIDYP